MISPSPVRAGLEPKAGAPTCLEAGSVPNRAPDLHGDERRWISFRRVRGVPGDRVGDHR